MQRKFKIYKIEYLYRSKIVISTSCRQKERLFRTEEDIWTEKDILELDKTVFYKMLKLYIKKEEINHKRDQNVMESRGDANKAGEKSWSDYQKLQTAFIKEYEDFYKAFVTFSPGLGPRTDRIKFDYSIVNTKRDRLLLIKFENLIRKYECNESLQRIVYKKGEKGSYDRKKYDNFMKLSYKFNRKYDQLKNNPRNCKWLWVAQQIQMKNKNLISFPDLKSEQERARQASIKYEKLK